MVGSANMDNRSLALNKELSLVAYDREVAGRLHRIFEEDLANSRAIDAQVWRSRSLWKRFWEYVSWPMRSLL
jgi:cardiolipin synthase